MRPEPCRAVPCRAVPGLWPRCPCSSARSPAPPLQSASPEADGGGDSNRVNQSGADLTPSAVGKHFLSLPLKDNKRFCPSDPARSSAEAEKKGPVPPGAERRARSRTRAEPCRLSRRTAARRCHPPLGLLIPGRSVRRAFGAEQTQQQRPFARNGLCPRSPNCRSTEGSGAIRRRCGTGGTRCAAALRLQGCSVQLSGQQRLTKSWEIEGEVRNGLDIWFPSHPESPTGVC